MNMVFLETVCSWEHMPRAQLFVRPCCSGVTPLETLERIRPRHLEMERVQMMTGCQLTLSRKVRERAKVKTNNREEIARLARPTRALQTSTRARTGTNLDIGRETVGIPVEERSTIATYSNTGKGKSKNTSKGKEKHVDVVETEQPQPSGTPSTVSYPSQDPSVVGELSCISSVDPWIMGVTINSVSSVSRQAGAECLLLDSGARLHACPLSCPGQKIPLRDPGIHTASGARLQYDGGLLMTRKLPEGRTIRVLFHACAVQKPILSLGRLLSRSTGVIFVQILEHCSFPDKTQTKRSHTRLRKEESLFFVEGTMVARSRDTDASGSADAGGR